MWFYERHIEYLSHLISPEGIQLLPEKLEDIWNMPAPKSTKEVKQFLGLTGYYYYKFVPRFSDISRPLTRLTHKDVLFKWTKECKPYFWLWNYRCLWQQSSVLFIGENKSDSSAGKRTQDLLIKLWVLYLLSYQGIYASPSKQQSLSSDYIYAPTFRWWLYLW